MGWGGARRVCAVTSRSCSNVENGEQAGWRGPSMMRRRCWVGEGTVQYLLILLVVITMACGAAASVTISFAPAYADDSGKGY